MEILRFFVCAYVSFYERNDFTGQVNVELTQEGLWAHTADEAVGRIISAPEYENKRPLDPAGIQTVEITTKLAEEIIANNVENA